MSKFEEYKKKYGLTEQTPQAPQTLQPTAQKTESKFSQFLKRNGYTLKSAEESLPPVQQPQFRQPVGLIHPLDRISDPVAKQKILDTEALVQQATAMGNKNRLQPLQTEFYQPMQKLQDTLSRYGKHGSSGFATAGEYQSFMDQIDQLRRLADGRKNQYFGDARMLQEFDKIYQDLDALSKSAQYQRSRMVAAQNTVQDSQDYLRLQEELAQLRAAKAENDRLRWEVTHYPASQVDAQNNRIAQIYQTYGDVDAAISKKEQELDKATKSREVSDIVAGVSRDPEFEKKSAYASTANGKNAKFFQGPNHVVTYTETGFEDITYDYINGNPDAVTVISNLESTNGTNFLGYDSQYLRELSKDEVRVFNYLYAQQGKDAAYHFLDLIKDDLYARQRFAREAEMADYARRHPVGASVSSVLMSPLKGLGYVGQAVDLLSDGELQKDASYNRFSYMSNATRNEVSKMIESSGKWGSVGSFAYQVGMSMGDFLMSTAVSGGNQTLALAIMGTGAAADTTIEAKDRNLSDGQAFLLGTIAGATEIVLEKLPLEALLGVGQAKSKVKYLLKNAFSESIEEGGSNIVNTLADIIIAQDESQWRAAINAYLESGKAKNEDEAFWMAMRDKALEIGIDSFAGFLSGGAMGTGGLAVHNISLDSKIRNLDADSVAAMINEGLSYGKNTESYRIASELETKVYRDEVITARDLKGLLQANGAAYEQKMNNVVESMDREGILPDPQPILNGRPTVPQTSPSVGNVSAQVPTTVPAENNALSAVLNTVKNGGTVSNSMAERILSDPQAVETLVQKTGMPLPETQSGRRAAVKDAITRLAQQSAIDTAIEDSNGIDNPAPQAINRQDINYGGIENAQSEYESAGDAGILSGRQGRGFSSGAGGSARGVASGTGGTQAETEQRTTASSRQRAVNSHGVEAVSTASLGVQHGSSQRTLRVMSEELWDDAQKATAQRIYEKTGKRTTFFIGALLIETPEGTIRANGAWTERGIIIQADHRRFSIDQIADHEIFHDMSFRTPWLVKQIEETIRQKFVGGELDQVITAYTKKLALLPENATPKQIEDATRLVIDEIMADAYAGVNRFSADAAQFHEDVVHQVAENVQPVGHSQENGVRNTNAPPENKYSIESLPDGKKYVRADRQVIFGNDPDSWSEQVEDYINGRIRRGQDVAMISEDGNTFTITKETAGKMADNHSGSGTTLDDDTFYVKANAAVHVDELIQVSRPSHGRTTPDHGNRHGAFAKDGWNYRTVFFMDFDGKYYRLQISVANGELGAVPYNIGDIEERSFPKITGSSTNGGALNGETSSEGSVPQPAQGVKGKFMQDDSDTDVLTEEDRQQVQNPQSDSEYRYLSEAPKSLAKKRENRYNEGKQFFPGSVFPPYKESQSDSHEIAERWARSDSAKVERQKLISHHGQWYLIESFDDMDYGYQIVRKIDNRNYEKEARFYGTITGFESSQNTSSENASILREGTSDGGERNRADSHDSEYGAKDSSLRPVGGEQVQRRNISPEQGATDWGSSQDWGESDESPINTFSDTPNRFMEDDSGVDMLTEEQQRRVNALKDVPEYRPDMREDDRQTTVPTEEFVADAERRAIKAKADLMRNIPKENFQGTDALDKLGIKIDNSVGNYSMVKSMIANDRSAKEIIREMRKAEKRLNATAGEKNFAAGIAEGYYKASEIPSDMDVDKVMELADYLWAVKAIHSDLIQQRRSDIKATLYHKMERIMQKVDTSKIKLSKAFTLHHRSAVRNMTTIFGPEIGEQLNDFLFHPVAANEAERIRFVNRMHDAVREFEGKDGKKKKLTKRESALVQMVIEGRAVEEAVAGLEMRHAIKNAAHNIRNGSDAGDAAREFSLNYEERKLAIQYSRWLQTLEALEDDRVDPVRINNAVKKYSELFDQFHEAINDFLVAHGYEPIGYIKGYAPHMQPEATQSALQKALAMLGIPPDVSTLPTSIAGLTKNYKPNKRWNPFFLSRRGDVTNYDIATAFESYVDYMSDVIYHTDDIMRVRQATEWFRKTFAPEQNHDLIDQALELRFSSFDEKLAFLRENDQISLFSVPSEANINDALDEYIEKLFGNLGNKTVYSDFVMWLDDYANKLAGKQLMADRNQEKTLGRTSLNVVSKLRMWFTRAQVAGNLSSALNQTAQLPQVIGENGIANTVLALKDMATFELRRTGWYQDSDFLTEKKGIHYIVNSPGEMIISGTFKPLEIMDHAMSTLAVRGRYLKEIKAGKSHAEAMAAADRFGRNVMGSRAKGSIPLAFQEKGPIAQFFHTFQVEAANSWEHLIVDLPQDFRQIQQTHGVRAAAGALAGVLIKALISAFLLNRFSEEMYGGTPAPYDVLGLTANFIASGHELSTNDFILTVMDNCWESVTGERIFDTEDEALSDGEFNWGAAVEDSWYNVSNDIPYLRNASALLGLGDDTLPLPDLVGTGKDMYKALKDENAGLFSYEMGQALLGLAGDVLPGGRQIEKTVSGLETAIRGGKYKGNGDNAKLQYPVDVDWDTAVRLALFGDAGASERREFYASGNSALTAKQTDVYDAMVDSGADARRIYDGIQDYRQASNDDTLSSVEQGKKCRDVIRNMEMSDELKFQMYSGLTNAESTIEKFQLFMDAGMSWDGVMDAYDQYSVLKADEDMDETEKATRFAHWVDEQSLTSGQKDIVKDQLLFWNMYPAQASKYEKFVDSGMDPDDAYELVEDLSALEPVGDADDVTVLQKWRTCVDFSSKESIQMSALAGQMTPEQFAKVQIAYDFDVSPDAYITFKEKLADITDGGTANQKDVEKAIRRMRGLSTKEKAVLWQLAINSNSAKNNPFSERYGERVLKAKQKAKSTDDES